MKTIEAINVLKARDILNALERITDMDYCGLTEYEIIDVIVKELGEIE